jgi:hypothetical protein
MTEFAWPRAVLPYLVESWQKRQEADGGRVRLDWDTLRAHSYHARQGTRHPESPIAKLLSL